MLNKFSAIKKTHTNCGNITKMKTDFHSWGYVLLIYINKVQIVPTDLLMPYYAKCCIVESDGFKLGCTFINS